MTRKPSKPKTALNDTYADYEKHMNNVLGTVPKRSQPVVSKTKGMISRLSGVGGWLVLAAITIAPILLLVILAQVINHSPAEKCQSRLSYLQDSDKYCGSNNEVQSKAADAKLVAQNAEEARRATLTAKQRCEEDLKISQNSKYREFVDYGATICLDDGTTKFISDSEINADAQALRSEACNIKGNVSYSTGEKIYHVPGDPDYNATTINTSYGERWFCSEAEAKAAGWRHATVY